LQNVIIEFTTQVPCACPGELQQKPETVAKDRACVQTDFS